MNSCAWTNGQYPWTGPQSQSSQTASQFILRNQQAGTTNNLYQYRTSNTEVQPPPYPNLPLRNEASLRQMTNSQNSVVPRQGDFFQQPSGRNPNSYYQETLNDNHPNSATKRQSRNPHLLVSDGASSQDFYQNSAQDSSSLHSITNANTTYSKQDMSANWNDSVNVNRKVGVVVSDHQPSMVWRSLLQNVNGHPTKPVSRYNTATLRSPEQRTFSRTMMPPTAHRRQTSHQNHRQSSTQHSPTISPTTGNISVSQACRNNSITTGLLSTEKILPAAINRTQQERVVQQKMIANIADDLKKSFFAGQNNHSPISISPRNSNVSQAMQLNSGLRSPQTTHSVMLGTQHRVDAASQQSFVPVHSHVKTTGYGSGNGSMADNTLLPEGKRGPEENMVGSLSDISQLMHMHNIQLSVANNHETLEITEKFPSLMAVDSSLHSSPGRTGTRAVAVVQPLSQDYYQAASKHIGATMMSAECDAADKCSRNPDIVLSLPDVTKNAQDQNLRRESNLNPENPNQTWSKNFINNHSPVSNDVPFLSSSDSTMHQDLLQKQLNVDDARSKLASSMQVYTQCDASPASCATSEMTKSQHDDKHKNATDPKPLNFGLSSVPTIPWTIGMLMNLVQDKKTAQMSLEEKFTQCDPITILAMFWNGKSANLVSKLKEGWYKDLITDCREYLSKHLTSDSVILSQVRHQNGFQKHLQSYHVLKDDEVYSEPPYKSSWLNINEQLDDIEKEFGFQYPLKHHLHTLEHPDNPHHVRTKNSKPELIVSEVSNKVLSQTDQVCDSGEDEQASIVETASRQTTSPDKMSADNSDPFYSFQIEVLPPEEAKVIFQQAQSMIPQSVDTDSQPERVMNSSMEGEIPEVIAVCDCKLKKHAINKLCCISKWVEIISGSESLETKCECKDNQNDKDSTDKTPDKEEVEMQEKLCAITPDERNNQVLKVVENLNNQSLAFSPTTDLTEDDNSSKKTNISCIDLNSSQSSIIVISESEDEDVIRNENEIPNLMPDLEKDSGTAQMDLTESWQSSVSGSQEEETKTEIQSEVEVDHLQDQLKSTGSTLSCTLVCSDREWEAEEECEQALMTSTGVAESSMETEEQTKITETAATQTTFSPHDTVERKRKRCDNIFPVFLKAKKCKPPVDQESVPVLEDSSKCKTFFLDVTDPKPSASNVRVLKLALFGSAPEDACALSGGRKSHISSQEGVSNGPPRPPKVLTVTTTVSTGEHSVKQRIYEKWMRSLPPSKIKRRRKRKAQKCTSSEVLPVSSEMSTWNVKPQRCLSLKRRRDISDRRKHGEGRTKMDGATLKKHADRETKKDKNRNQKENNVLKFSVLPNTFNFKDGSKGRKETRDLVADKPKFVKGEDKSPNKTAMRARDTWCPNSERKYRPLHSPPAPKTSILFHEFQKKYREKKQPSMDE